MKLSSLGEFGMIRAVRRSFSRTSSRVLAGIGDDAAALRCSPSATLLATTDMLVEGVHFDRAYTDFASLGWKAAAANLSDIAAMGGVPRFCLTALALPPELTVEQVRHFYHGLKRLLRRYGTDLAGGDTCRSPGGMTVSITLLGEVEKGRMVLRSGARPGDRIFVTGTLGDSAAGLEILRSRKSGGRSRKSEVRRLVLKHLRPEPRVAWGRMIARSGCATAMIDVSDGLSSDLAHLCEESGVGAEVLEDRIPLSKELRRADGIRLRPVQYALSGGEDYELLFTVAPAKVPIVTSLGMEATEIGVITRQRGMALIAPSGRRTALAPAGYDHFPAGGSGRRRDRGRGNCSETGSVHGCT